MTLLSREYCMGTVGRFFCPYGLNAEPRHVLFIIDRAAEGYPSAAFLSDKLLKIYEKRFYYDQRRTTRETRGTPY